MAEDAVDEDDEQSQADAHIPAKLFARILKHVGQTFSSATAAAICSGKETERVACEVAYF